ncbi:hypothetical protein CFAM422_002508 [Trichoderma lentiforme]|uniref:DUF7730 domain-containing protein n=1 Tax=Trichoderma lentiforme TaxID=1567552 RepID=A0A9P5CHA5_9HYPO|nr:hypothetical protein CFAM422_002508 [Trichoderma lentiforme]
MDSIDREPETATFELLRLPLEIRRLVYYQYFFNGNNMCRISTAYQIPTRVVAENDAPVNRSRVKESSRIAIAQSLRSTVNAMPLLLCSSQIYDEVIDVLYRGVSFCFDDLNVLREFLDVRRDAGNEDLIRSIYFNWTSFVWLHHGQQSAVQQYLNEHWHPLCRRLDEMNSLTSFVVSIKLATKQTAKRTFERSNLYQLLTWPSSLNLSLENLEGKKT